MVVVCQKGKLSDELVAQEDIEDIDNKDKRFTDRVPLREKVEHSSSVGVGSSPLRGVFFA